MKLLILLLGLSSMYSISAFALEQKLIATASTSNLNTIDCHLPDEELDNTAKVKAYIQAAKSCAFSKLDQVERIGEWSYKVPQICDAIEGTEGVPQSLFSRSISVTAQFRCIGEKIIFINSSPVGSKGGASSHMDYKAQIACRPNKAQRTSPVNILWSPRKVIAKGAPSGQWQAVSPAGFVASAQFSCI